MKQIKTTEMTLLELSNFCEDKGYLDIFDGDTLEIIDFDETKMTGNICDCEGDNYICFDIIELDEDDIAETIILVEDSALEMLDAIEPDES